MKKLKERMKEPNTTFTTSKSPDIVVAKYQNSAGIIGATLTISKKNELFNLDNKKY